MSKTKTKSKKCGCEICVKWGPWMRRVLKKLTGRDKKLFEEFMMNEASQSDDLCAANAKLEGTWPGWEWMPAATAAANAAAEHARKDQI